MKLRNPFSNLTKFEWGLWLFSVLAVSLCFFGGKEGETLTLLASLIGVTALIFIAKGDVVGQMLTVIFSLMYAVISLKFRYYGEMITYLGMTAPIALLSVISWIRHPYEKGKGEVEVAHLSRRTWGKIIMLTIFVTVIFYFILRFFNTANLAVSTVSITTSFLASYLMFCRSPYYALAYAANDIVLITLWVLACLSNIAYLPMVACFGIFFLNDLYGFFNWRNMRNRQGKLK